MPRSPFSIVLLASCLTVSACGGGGDMGDSQTTDAAAAASGLECYIARGSRAEAQDRPSPLRSTPFSFPGGEGLLCYGAPSARGRQIMGGLVPWGAAWRIGANEPTTIHLSARARIGGVELEPGSYSLYAVPTEADWEIFLNSSWERWGIPIDGTVRASEVGSFTVTPEATDAMVERLAYSWQPEAGRGGRLTLEWADTRVSIPVEAVTD